MNKINDVRRSRALTAAMAVTALLLSACGSNGDGESAGAKAPIKIGVLMEFTGAGSDYGTRARDMVEMVLDEYGGKIGGHPLEVVYADTATDASKAVAKARQLIERDKVDVVFGPVFSDAQDAIAPYLAQENVMAMAPVGANWSLSKYKNWVVFPGTLDSFCQPGGEALRAAGHETLTVLAADYVAGHQVVDPVAEGFKAHGGKVVQKLYAPLGTVDFGSYMSSLKNSDVLAAWTVMPDELTMLKTFIKFKGGSNTDLFLCEADNVTSEQLKQMGDGILGTKGMVAVYSPDVENAENKKFIAQVEERYKRTPTMPDGSNYLLFKTLLEGLKETNGNATLDVLRSAILNSSRDSIAGPLAWTKNGYALSNRYLATVAEADDGRYFWKTDEVFEKVRDSRDHE